MEVIKVIVVDDDRNSPAPFSLEGVFNTTNCFACAWSKDVGSGAPLICVAGNSKKIQIYDVTTGELRQACAILGPIYTGPDTDLQQQTLTGHGRACISHFSPTHQANCS